MIIVKNRLFMNSRQRVLNALNHKNPDRVPIDFGGFQSGIHKKAYLKLIKYLNIKDNLKILDPVQQLALPCDELLQRFHADIRYISTNIPSQQNSHESYKDEFGVTWSIQDEQQNYMSISVRPLANTDIQTIKNYIFPNDLNKDRFIGIRENALAISNNGTYALSTGIGGSMFETCSNMRGTEKWYIDTIENIIIVETLLDKVLNYWIDFYKGFLNEIGDIVDIVIIGDDLAGQNGPLFSLDFYRSMLKPRQKKLIEHIKSLTQAKICYHTCGSCFDFIPDLIEIGIDILNPLQIGLKNMEPQKIKDAFGKKISLWGGATLPYISEPEIIREEVQKNIEIFNKGSGYIFSSTHNIQFDVPPENIVALFDSAYAFDY